MMVLLCYFWCWIYVNSNWLGFYLDFRIFVYFFGWCYVYLISFIICGYFFFFFFFKQKTAYEMRISDWSSDVCSSDLIENEPVDITQFAFAKRGGHLFNHPKAEIFQGRHGFGKDDGIPAVKFQAQAGLAIFGIAIKPCGAAMSSCEAV